MGCPRGAVASLRGLVGSSRSAPGPGPVGPSDSSCPIGAGSGSLARVLPPPPQLPAVGDGAAGTQARAARLRRRPDLDGDHQGRCAALARVAAVGRPSGRAQDQHRAQANLPGQAIPDGQPAGRGGSTGQAGQLHRARSDAQGASGRRAGPRCAVQDALRQAGAEVWEVNAGDARSESFIPVGLNCAASLANLGGGIPTAVMLCLKDSVGFSGRGISPPRVGRAGSGGRRAPAPSRGGVAWHHRDAPLHSDYS